MRIQRLSPPLIISGHGLLKGSLRGYRQREGATRRNSTVSSDSHLEIRHQWSDQCHLFCFNL